MAKRQTRRSVSISAEGHARAHKLRRIPAVAEAAAERDRTSKYGSTSSIVEYALARLAEEHGVTVTPEDRMASILPSQRTTIEQKVAERTRRVLESDKVRALAEAAFGERRFSG